MASKTKTGSTVIRKKKWYPVMAPRLFDYPIAETQAFESKSLVGRTLFINLMTLTNDPKRQNVNIKFLITSANEQAANADPVGYYIMPSSLKRLMRRRTDRVDDSILCETADSINVRIKPFILTRSIVKASIRSKMRKMSREYIKSYAKKTCLIDIIQDIVSYKLQDSLRDILKKVYPLRNLEIKSFELAKDVKDERSTVEIVQSMRQQRSNDPQDQAETREEPKKVNVET